MDLTSILLFCLMSLVIGAVLMILVQYYAFVKYFNVPDQDADKRPKSLNEKYQLPDVSIRIWIDFLLTCLLVSRVILICIWHSICMDWLVCMFKSVLYRVLFVNIELPRRCLAIDRYGHTLFPWSWFHMNYMLQLTNELNRPIAMYKINGICIGYPCCVAVSVVHGVRHCVLER